MLGGKKLRRKSLKGNFGERPNSFSANRLAVREFGSNRSNFSLQFWLSGRDDFSGGRAGRCGDFRLRNTLRFENSNEIQSLTLKLFGDFSAIFRSAKFIRRTAFAIILTDDELQNRNSRCHTGICFFDVEDENAWSEGRAGMLYRDLIPVSFGGSFVASHISIPEGVKFPITCIFTDFGFR